MSVKAAEEHIDYEAFRIGRIDCKAALPSALWRALSVAERPGRFGEDAQIVVVEDAGEQIVAMPTRHCEALVTRLRGGRNMTNLDRRTRRLEQQFQPKCPTCNGNPIRVAVIDDATDAVLSENFPPSGCRACGQPIYRELHIIGEGDDAENGDDLAAKGA